MGDMLPFLTLLLCMVLLPWLVGLLAWRTGHGMAWLAGIGVLGLGVWSGPALWAGHGLIGNDAAYRALDGVITLSVTAFLATIAAGLVLVCKRWRGEPRW